MSGRRLTKHQQRRIKQNISKRQTALDSQDLEQGLVIAHHGKKLLVEDRDGQIIPCHARQNIGSVVCGDQVLWHNDNHHQEGVVSAITPRESLLLRPGFGDKLKPVAANITLIGIVISPKPEPQENLIDRYLVAAEDLHIRPVLVCNKMDLLNEAEMLTWKERFSVYTDIGYELVFTSTKKSHGLDDLSGKFRDNNSILVGQSGVGKSSIINALLPDKQLKVNKLSEQINQGQHTTSHSELHHLADNSGNIIDSPGVRDFRLGHLENSEIQQGFIEFRPYLGHCKFSNCEHRQEPGCALRRAVAEGNISRQRLNSYFEILAS